MTSLIYCTNCMEESGFIDGVFDGYHYGHVNAIFQAKKMCKNLHAATHSDEEVLIIKQKRPIFSYMDRLEMLKNCRFIDYIHPVTKYNTDEGVLDNLGCTTFFHDNYDLDKFPLSDLKNTGRLRVYNRTNGISSTNLQCRLKSIKDGFKPFTNNDIIYLKYIFNSIKEYINKSPSDKVLILRHNDWDFLNVSHIKIINETKQMFPTYSICIDLGYSQEPLVYNKHEIAIILISLRNVDNVVIDRDDLPNTKLCIYSRVHELENNLQVKRLPIPKFDLSDYKKILEKQFESILMYFKTTEFNPNDIVIFDIDEVVLCNLMYHNIDIQEFENDNRFTRENGLIPLVSQCQELFDFIHGHSIKYSFITGRREYIRDITIENLELFNLDGYTNLYLCDNDYVGDIAAYKTLKRKEIEENGFKIVVNIGDQISDTSGGYSGVPFLIFNPYYQTV